MKKILLVEDDSKVRFLLRRLLEKKFRMEVYEAENGAIGLELCRQHNPKLVFLDISMPVMDGIEFLTELRKENTEIPVVVMTCNNDRTIVAKMLTLGISDYIIKSEFIMFLESRIAEILEKHFVAFRV